MSVPKFTVALPQCPWHCRAGTGLVGSGSKLRKGEADLGLVPREVLCWGAGDKMAAPLCQTQLCGPAGLWRCLSSRPSVWSKDGCRHPSGDLGICQSWAAASFPGEPSFQDSQLLLRGGSKGLSPEVSGVTDELRGCGDGLLAPRHRDSATCIASPVRAVPHVSFSWLMVPLSLRAGRVIFNCLPCAA